MNIQLSECQAIDTELQSIDQEAIKTQNINYLMELGLKIAGWISFTGNEMAKAKKIWSDKKAKVYQDVRLSMKAIGDDYKPMVFKDYVAAKCAQEEYGYDSIERTHRSCERVLDFIRTCISALKSELFSSQQTANY